MTTPHMRSAPDGSFTVGDGWRWGQDMDVELIDLLTMGGVIPTPGTVIETAAGWLKNLPLPILTMMFRPLLPLSQDKDWIDVDTAVKTILDALPLQQISQFWQWVTTVFDPFKGIVDKLIEVLAGVLVNPGGVLQPVADFIHGLLKVSEWKTWLATIFQPIADGLAAIVTTVHDLIDGIFSMFSGTTGVGKTVAEALAALADWLGGAFKALSDGVAAITTTVQTLLDAIFSLFGGTAGTGKTVAEAITALTGWFTGPFKALSDLVQTFIDGVSNIFNPTAGVTGHPVQDAIKAIFDILNIGQSAQTAANTANIGLAAIKATSAGGHVDEFNDPISASLPAPWVATYTGSNAGTWGPNGNGKVTWKPLGVGDRTVIYRRNADPLTGPSGEFTLVLSKPPLNDVVAGDGTFSMFVHMSATDKSCVGVEVGPRWIQFKSVNAAGASSNLGGKVTIPTCKAGDVFILKFDATTLTLLRNGITAGTHTYTPPPGQQIGFGAHVGALYTGLGGHPAPEFAGLAWHN